MGGHSKGGNLALVAGMYANFLVRDKIIKVYYNDGPGLLKEQFESKYYNNVKNKLIHIIPNYSVVGLLLHHEDDYIVVRSAKKGAMSHDLYTWVIENTTFMRAELNSFSKLLDDEITVWLNKYNTDERKRFVLALFDIFEKSNINSFIDIMDNKKLILDLINKSKELSDKDVEMFKDLLRMLFNCFKDVKKEDFKAMFERKQNV